MDCFHHFIINQIKIEVRNLSASIKHKRLTDKQILYIYNSLIIPKIEYYSQLTVLNKSECDAVIAPFRKMFKNKLQMATTA